MKRSCMLFVPLPFVLAFVLATMAQASNVSSTTEETSPTEPLPAGTFTSSAHSDAWKIANALAAAPSTIAEKATVRDMPADPKSGMSSGRILRQGSNGWTCLPDTPGKPQHDPMCVDETMMKWMDATYAGRKADIDRVGLSYMLLGELRADPDDLSATKPPPGKDWIAIGPHVMVVLPDACRDALGDVNRDLTKNEAYVTNLRSPSSPLWIIPVAKGGERIQALQSYVLGAGPTL
jgi:hypothetical protein